MSGAGQYANGGTNGRAALVEALRLCCRVFDALDDRRRPDGATIAHEATRAALAAARGEGE